MRQTLNTNIIVNHPAQSSLISLCLVTSFLDLPAWYVAKAYLSLGKHVSSDNWGFIYVACSMFMSFHDLHFMLKGLSFIGKTFIVRCLDVCCLSFLVLHNMFGESLSFDNRGLMYDHDPTPAHKVLCGPHSYISGLNATSLIAPDQYNKRK